MDQIVSTSSLSRGGGGGSATPGQKRLLEAMPELADCRFPQIRDAIPATNYTDPARYGAELEAVWKSVPVIAGPSARRRRMMEERSLERWGERASEWWRASREIKCRHSCGRWICRWSRWR